MDNFTGKVFEDVFSQQPKWEHSLHNMKQTPKGYHIPPYTFIKPDKHTAQEGGKNHDVEIEKPGKIG